jgi:transcription antitermination factor NusG
MMNDSGSIMGNEWYALRVRARAEFTVARSLERRGFECFAPGWETRSNVRRKVVMTAAFPGYIFIRFSLKDLFRVLNIPGVQQVMGYGSPTSVDEETISALKTAFAGRIPVMPSAYIQHGDAVEVVRGPMRGATGILVRTKDEFRLVIQIHILQRSVYTEVDADAVVPMTAASVAA